MEMFGQLVVYVIMICAVSGAVAAIFREKSELGKQFIEGIYSIGPIFLPVAGIMAAMPYLTSFVNSVFGPLMQTVGADPAMAATTIIAVDMGGYQLAKSLSLTNEGWIMAMVTGFMAGATIVFSIPVGLAMLDKKDHKYMALGIMSGLLTIPIGVFITSSILLITNVKVRDAISTDAESSYQLMFTFGQIFSNLIPLIIICLILAVGLWFIPDKMIKGFNIFGKLMYSAIKLILVLSIVEYFTSIFSTIFGSWGFHPIIADAEDQFRALEIAGYVGVMLAGAFPMVYLIKRYMTKPLELIGKKFGFSSTGSAGILAGAANILALFKIIKDMPAKDKVKTIAFAVCAAFLFGDHLAFTANFQPTIILPVIIGKLTAGLLAIVIANWIAVPKAIMLEREEEIKKIDIEKETNSLLEAAMARE